ncbi:hypothetical protein HMPREF1868_00555 [Olsenella sp. DNF00959]|nr:hypothetical protein HMPREF1868_00555 [Olsenella sp. DNF00959]
MRARAPMDGNAWRSRRGRLGPASRGCWLEQRLASSDLRVPS